MYICLYRYICIYTFLFYVSHPLEHPVQPPRTKCPAVARGCPLLPRCCPVVARG